MIDLFQLSERQYQILAKQVIMNHPKEAGGFLGGKDGLIRVILPVFNQALTNKETQFQYTFEDHQRAHELCAKHHVDYYGVYHSHPSGAYRPSFQDMNRVQRYLFIITQQLETQMVTIHAYQAKGHIPVSVPVKIIANDTVKVVDIMGKIQQQTDTYAQQVTQLYDQIEAIKADIRTYPIYDAHEGGQFQTEA